MGRHSAPEGRHRRHGALLAQAGLVSVLALVAIAVLFGSGVARDRTVSGTLASSQTGDQASSGALIPTTPAESPEATSEPHGSDTTTTVTTVTAPPASNQVNAPENRGVDAPSAPTSTESASDSADTTAPTTATHSDRTRSATPTGAPSTVKGFASCAEANAASVSMIPRTDPRYTPKLDHDGDGIACDRHGDPPTSPTPSPNASPSREPITAPSCVPAG